jgi:hypothetical protein
MHEPTLAQSPLGSVPSIANAVPQPFVVSQVLRVHGADGGGQTVPLPPPHTPLVQVVPVTHALPLGHAVPSASATKPQPVDGAQVLASHGLSDAGHITDMPPAQTPLVQVSPATHMSPDAQLVPSPTLLVTQPCAGSQLLV